MAIDGEFFSTDPVELLIEEDMRIDLSKAGFSGLNIQNKSVWAIIDKLSKAKQ